MRLWLESRLPFICASMRNTPDASSVPSNRTPLSMKPVNSCCCASLPSLFDRHCMKNPQPETMHCVNTILPERRKFESQNPGLRDVVSTYNERSSVRARDHLLHS